MSTKKQIGAALGRVASGLHIVTTKFDDKEDAVLASWVNQCSFDPPSVSIALAVTRSARLLVEASQAFIVNVLGEESNDLLKRFSKAPKPGTSIYEGLKTKKGIHGIAILEDAVSYLECEMIEQAYLGDHVVYFGEIVGGKMLKGGEPYIHVRDNGFNY